MVTTVVQIDRAHFSDAHAVGQPVQDNFFGVGAEKLAHFVIRFEVVAFVGEGQLGVLHGGAGLDAEQDFVRVGVGGVDVMDVVGQQEVVLQAVAGGHFNELLVDDGQFGDGMFLQFQIEPLFAEDVEVFAHEGVG